MKNNKDKPTKTVKPKLKANLIQGENLEKTSQKKILEVMHGKPAKPYSHLDDIMFAAKVDTATQEELWAMAIKFNIIPCADVRRLKQQIRAKRESGDIILSTRSRDIINPTKEEQNSVNEILNRHKK